MPPDLELEELVLQAATGDEHAWQKLWGSLEPRLCSTLRRTWFRNPPNRREDEIRDMFVAIMARLREGQFRRLQGYLVARGADPELTFMRWVHVVARRVAIDCIRARHWIETVDLQPDKLPCRRFPVTSHVAVNQIIRYAIANLSAPQQQALELWLASRSDADRHVRAAVGRLRRHFRPDSSCTGSLP